MNEIIARWPRSAGRALRIAAGVGFAAVAVFSSAPALAQGALKGYAPAEWAKIVAAAKAEGKLILYGTSPVSIMNHLKAGFEKAYPGMVVEPTRVVGIELIGKLDQERSAGVDGADVIETSEVVWLAERAKENAFKAPVGPAAGAWPAAYLVSGVSPILALNVYVLVYNTNLIKSTITGYQDLLKPEFKGKIGVVEANSSVFVAWYDWLEKTQGADFLAKLAAQNPRLYPSVLPAAQATAAGEIWFASASVPSVVLPLIAQGAPLKMVVPTPSAGSPHAVAVLAWAKRPNAALVFMDYLMSPAGQTAWAGRGELASPLGVPGSLNAPTMSVLDQSKYPPAVTNAYQTKWGTIFKGK